MKRSSRRAGVVLLVLTSLLPWRVALACTHQPALIQHRCCCEETRHAGHCPRTPDGVQGPCCDIVFSAAPGQVADEDTWSPLSRAEGKSPPALPSDAAPRLAAAIPDRVAQIVLPDGPGWHSGRGIYLETARLRL